MKARVIDNRGPKMHSFVDLQPGDFLVGETGSVGVKTIIGGILWLTIGPNSRARYAGRMTSPYDISPDKQYAIPSDVVITL